jgi:dienelactone hydrolase
MWDGRVRSMEREGAPVGHDEDVRRTELRPGVHVRPATDQTRAVVLVLHGGKEHSLEESDPMHLSARRMRPFARALHRQGRRHGVAVWSVQYRFRGWNGSQMSPVHDARWALEEVRRRHGDVPVVLVGHSMGGRTAVNVLGDANVVGMVALAPWLPPHEPVYGARDRDVLVAHGTVDRRTSARLSLDWAEQARPVARSMAYVHVRRSGHSLLRRARLWTDLTVGFALRSLGLDPSIGRTAANVLAQAAEGAPTLTA